MKTQAHKISIVMITALAISGATQLKADTITVQSTFNNLAAVTSESDPRLETGPSGVTFLPGILSAYSGGSWVSVATPPAGTEQISLGGSGTQNSGFVETTFTLPSTFYHASILGELSVDEVGYIWLNGNFIGQAGTMGVNAPNDLLYTSNVQSDFQSGVNTLVISDINTNGPSGLEYYGNVNFGTTPEPGTWLLLGSGLLALAGLARSRADMRA